MTSISPQKPSNYQTNYQIWSEWESLKTAISPYHSLVVLRLPLDVNEELLAELLTVGSKLPSHCIWEAFELADNFDFDFSLVSEMQYMDILLFKACSLPSLNRCST